MVMQNGDTRYCPCGITKTCHQFLSPVPVTIYHHQYNMSNSGKVAHLVEFALADNSVPELVEALEGH